MGESSDAGRAPSRPLETNRRPPTGRVPPAGWIALAGLVVVLVIFPPFHVVPLDSAVAPGSSKTSDIPVRTVQGNFAANQAAETFWQEQLLPAAAKAVEARMVLAAMKSDPKAALKQHATQVGIGGAAYYFVRGSGRVVSVEKSRVTIAVDGVEGATIAVRIGPIFGNTLRDGAGLLNVNAFPGLQEFNALAAELNHLAEARVLAPLKDRWTEGAAVRFAGCAEAPEALPDGPWLTVIPAQLEIR